jgi:hypothetical protein|tara:strand:+ start:226 stop:408 length:183 start_codon:yes stop_codon:yes gene_type:complete
MNILELILEKVSERYVDVQEEIVRGDTKDYAEYQHLCGVLKGLSWVRLYIKELQQNVEEY